MAHEILRLQTVMARTGLSRSSIYAKMNKGEFPRSIKLGPRAVGWVGAEIDAHIQDCIDASRSGDSE